jgi:hypothetical protein
MKPPALVKVGALGPVEWPRIAVAQRIRESRSLGHTFKRITYSSGYVGYQSSNQHDPYVYAVKKAQP